VFFVCVDARNNMCESNYPFFFKFLIYMVGSMSITYVFSRNVTYKKHEKREMFSLHRNHEIHYYFSKLVVQHTKWKKFHNSMFESVFDQPGGLWLTCTFHPLSPLSKYLQIYKQAHIKIFEKQKKIHVCFSVFYYFYYIVCECYNYYF